MDTVVTPLTNLQDAHRQFLELVKDVRPALHRYLTRMTGSVIEGEDLVQETLARGYYELSQLRELPTLKTWLFRIAHHRTLDYLRQRERLAPQEATVEVLAETPDAALELETQQTMLLAVGRFVELAPSQRACVILKDVLGYSLEESAAMLDLTVPAVKAALHRGRVTLRAGHADGATSAAITPVVAEYARLFNAHDWDGVRALLVDDVRLDLNSKEQRLGKSRVGHYFTNYGAVAGWRMTTGRVDGREVLLVRKQHDDARPSYCVELLHAAGRITAIRDFRYVPYILVDARVEEPSSTPSMRQ